MIKGSVDKNAVKAIERLAWCQSFDTKCVDELLSDGQTFDEIRKELFDAYVTLKEMVSAVENELEETGNAIDYLRHKQER